jgi:hypothetical protein
MEWWTWHAFVACAALLAASIKRENALLLIIAPVLLSSRAHRRLCGRELLAVAALWLAAVGLVATDSVWSIHSEIGEYGAFSFGAWRALHTIPVVGQALILPSWFGFLTPAAIVGAWWSIRNVQRRNQHVDSITFIAIAVFAGGLIVLYAAHVRSAYQLAGVTVEPFDYMRYLTNLAPVLCVLASGVSVRLLNGGRPWVRRVATGLVGVGLLLSAAKGRMERTELVSAEVSSRRIPAINALTASGRFGNVYPIVTLEPLLIQLYGTGSTKVVSMPSLTSEHLTQGALYLQQDHYNSAVDQRRYASASRVLSRHRHLELQRDDGWVLWLIPKGE